MASVVYSQDSMMTKATRLGMLETVGLGWRVGQRYIERIKAVTPEQVRAVARKYLIDDHKTVAVLQPEAITSVEKKSIGVSSPPGELR
jgi:zinc protease